VELPGAEDRRGWISDSLILLAVLRSGLLPLLILPQLLLLVDDRQIVELHVKPMQTAAHLLGRDLLILRVLQLLLLLAQVLGLLLLVILVFFIVLLLAGEVRLRAVILLGAILRFIDFNVSFSSFISNYPCCANLRYLSMLKGETSRQRLIP